MEIKIFIVGDLETSCYLLVSEKEALVIDPGGEVADISEELEKSGVNLKYIINTHYHPDHILGNKDLKEKTGAEILIHESEKDFIKFEPDRFLKEGQEIKVGDTVLRILCTPGHTKGSICLLGNNFIFTGDTLFEGGYGRTDLPGGSQKEIEESLKMLSSLLKPGTVVYPGHGDSFKV